ncbi:MAG: hypothetical protein JSS76_18440 [Bacteroidetes bacterium]|nr:hypothetical protein [Bacteroidota bacterium]
MLEIYTSNPSELLSAIKRDIKAGKIKTWNVFPDGDFFHSPDQWADQAFFKPVVKETFLELQHNFRPNHSKPASEVYAVYHGRFAEMIFAHFLSKVSSIRMRDARTKS